MMKVTLENSTLAGRQLFRGASGLLADQGALVTPRGSLSLRGRAVQPLLEAC